MMSNAEGGSRWFDPGRSNAHGVGPTHSVEMLLVVVVVSASRGRPGWAVGVALEAEVNASCGHHGCWMKAGEHDAVRLWREDKNKMDWHNAQ